MEKSTISRLKTEKKGFFSSKIWIKKDPNNDLAQQIDKNVVYFNDYDSVNISVLHLGYSVHIIYMNHMMIMKYLLPKSQENNLHFNMTNNTVVDE